MRRRLMGGALILVAVLSAACWFSRPTPGRSLFADWDPHAKGKVWSITGSPDSPHVVFVDPTGALQPQSDSYSIHYFVYDRDRARLCVSGKPDCTLAHGCLPTATVRSPGMVASYETFTSGDECVSVATLRNVGKAARRLSFYAVAVPYQLAGRQCGSLDMMYHRSSLAVSGEALLSCDSRPTSGAVYAAGTGDEICDITGYVRKGMLPRTRFVHGGLKEITSGAVRFDLVLEPNQKKRLVFRSSGGDASKPVSEARDEFVRRWEAVLGRVGLEVPDGKCEDCFRASAAYLVMLSRDGKPVPGPTKYGSFWVRDCAYMADALYYAGQGDLVPPALEQLKTMQLANGGFSARAGAGDNELDAPGEAIYTLVQHYRRTGDLNWLRGVWPNIANACRYVRAKRPQRENADILPASVSAEDLGKATQQHYWDDFWCIRGLRDAAYAARELGKRRDAAWISAEADSLLAATRASIDETMARNSIAYIPNGPQEVASSSMARGTSCALWPCAVLDPSDPLVRRSFDTYWSKWIAPSNGGFVHRDHFWPYAGMDLARGYLMLGQRDRAWAMLKWTLDHDPTHGFFAWPEGMFTNDLTLAEGDMPHGWMCAAYISLVRNMLVRESGGDLVLLSGVPSDWLHAGARIAIRDFPTEFGKVSYRAEVFGDSLKLTVSGARPPGAYRVELPGGLTTVVPRNAREIRIALKL